MEKKQNVPALRFREFCGDWGKYNLNMLSGLITKGTTPLDKSGKGNVNFVKIENIDANTGKIHITQKISQKEHNGYLKRSQLKENDILFSIAGTLGRVAVVNTNILPANTNQALAIIRLKKGHFKYIKTYLQGKAVANFLKANPTVGAQPNLSLAQVGSLEIIMPEKSEEQGNIADFFQYLDELIFRTVSKIQKIQRFRQAMLTKLFPREGAAEPELRFRGFSGAWRENKIADIAGSTYGGGTPSTLCREFWQGNIPWIQSSDILLDDIWRVVPHKHISKNALKKSNIRIIPKNSIAIVIRVGVGKLAFIPFSYTTSQDFLSLGNLCIDSAFATCAIKKKMEEDILIVQGTSIKGVTKNEILNKTIMIPQSVLEQQKIGNFFKGLDSFISLQQKRLERMQRLKAALLEKMFV